MQAELVAVLKRLALPMDQVIAQGRAAAAVAASSNGAGAAPSSSAPGPPLSFFPPSPEALMMMTGMGPPSGRGAGVITKGEGERKPAATMAPAPPPSIPQQPPPPKPAAATVTGDKMVLVTLSRDRGGGGGGARLLYPSRLAAAGTEEGFREEVSGLVTARLLPLLAGEGGGPTVDAAALEVDWKPALSYRKTVLRLTGGMPTMVLERVEEDGAEGLVEREETGDEGQPVAFDVLVKGVV